MAAIPSPVAHAAGHATVRPLYAWTVFALSFGLMLSDYLTRNVISAVFPMLKVEWALTDGQLGALVSVVALVVAIAAIPVALIADRWGRVKSVTAMATLWCLATIGCGISQSYTQMLVARGLVGLGEAGYASAGGAILVHVFPPERRAVIFGAFNSAALFGSVAGVALGGAIAVRYGWRAAFISFGAVSLILVVLYRMLVRDYATVKLVKAPDAAGGAARHMNAFEIVREVFVARSVVLTYVASGLSMFVMGVVNAWLPTFFGRYYALPADKAGLMAAAVIVCAGIGMIVGGGLVDRLGRRDGRNKLRVPAAYTFGAFALLTTAFALPPGTVQLALLFAGVFVAAGPLGAAAAVVVDIVHPGLRATATATVVLANNLFGFAPGPVVVGALSDHYGLQAALTIAPAVGLLASVFFLLAARHYDRDRGHFAEPPDAAAGNAAR
ncbi:MAG: MFS transporter [Burkholderiales bacterium]